MFAEVAREKPVGSEIQHRRTARKLATLRDKEAIATIRRKAQISSNHDWIT